MKVPPAKPRFGLIGTGAWASMVHAPAAGSCPEIAFTSVLGRREEATRSLATMHGAQPFRNLEEFLETVDIVAIAVPPEEQPRFALAAAEAGKHALLEKPLAIDPLVAQTIATAFVSRGLESVVFFPQLILPEIGTWIRDTIEAGDCFAAGIERFSNILTNETDPFHGSPWRIGAGPLWDSAPHAVALLLAVLGEFAEVHATRGRGDIVSLTLLNAKGAVATLTLMRDAPAPLPGRTAFYGSSGARALPAGGNWNADSIEACRIALRTLAAAANGRPGARLPCDANFGAEVTAVLAAAATSLDERRTIRISPRST